MTSIRSAIRAAVQPAVRSVYGAFDEPQLFDQFLGSIPGAYTFSRSGAQTGVDSSNLLYQAATGVPAFVNGQGVLLEGARTNLLTYSEQFDNAAWAKTNSTISANAATSPDGASVAEKLVATSASGEHNVNRSVTMTAGQAYTFSIYIKAGEYSWAQLRLSGLNANFDLSSGAVGSVDAGVSAAITAVGGGWYRCSHTHTATGNSFAVIRAATANNVTAFTGDDASGIYVWGAQLEQAAFASSYIPTTTGSAVRNATSLSRNWTLPVNNFSGQIKVRPRFAGTDASDYPPFVSFYLDANNFCVFYRNNANSNLVFEAKISGTNATAVVSGLSWSAGGLLNFRFRKSAAGIKLWVNSTASAETTSGVAPNAWGSALNSIRLNQSQGATISFNAIESLKLWHSAMPDSFLAGLA